MTRGASSHAGGAPARRPGLLRTISLRVAPLLAALLLASSPARADNECGAASGVGQTRTCTGTSYPNGIWYHNLGGTGTTYTFNVPGSASGTTITATGSGGGAGQRSVGIYLHGGVSSPELRLNVGGATGGTAHVVNIVQGATTSNSATRNNGIYMRQGRSLTHTYLDVRAGVTIGTASAPMRQNGIWMVLNTQPSSNRGAFESSIANRATIYARRAGIRHERTGGGGTRASTTITNHGAIHAGVNNAGETVNAGSPHNAPHGISVLYGASGRDHNNILQDGALTIENNGAITVTGAYTGIFLNYWGHGRVTATNTGDITAAMGTGVNLDLNNTDTNNASFTNSGDVTAAVVGLRFARDTASTGTTTFENSGDVTVTGAAGTNVGHAVLLPNAGAGGAVTIENSGVLRSKNHALYATMTHATNSAALTLTNTGSAMSENGDGIRVERVGSGAIILESGAADTTVSGGAFGIYASHTGTAGTVSVTHTAGAVGGRTGILAEVTRASAQSATRATNQPLLDVTWTAGTFTHGTGQAASDTGRFAAASAGRVVALDQEATAQKAARPGQAAGIEARLLSWSDVVTQVATGDDPGAFANLAAQQAAVPTGATAADNAYVAQFRAALENDELAVASGVLTAIDATATSMDDITDAEIVAYLREDNAGRRTLLRSILASGLSEKEQAVLKAVATNTGLTAALDDTAAAFSTTYKNAVNALLNRHQVNDLRVAVNGGSIVSRGDGVRAYYATYNSGNGGIDVTIAAGATVTGGVSGVYVANAGTGLTVARKYTPGWTQGQNGDDMLAVNQITVAGGATTTTAMRDQLVTVHGTVTGGTDAGVRLSGGGGVLVMENAKVHAGSSVGILAENGPALVYVDGEVKGIDGGAAAVHLTGGGSVTIGLNGKVLANGADYAIRGSDDADVPTLVTVATGGMFEYKEDATDRIAGSVAGFTEVIFRQYDQSGAPTSTATTVSVMSGSGMLDVSAFPWRPVTPDLTTSTYSCRDSGRCILATRAGAISGRTGVYAAVPSASAPGVMRADADQPLIGVTWTGTFAHGEGASDNGRFTATNPVAVVAFDRTAAAGKAVEETVRFGGAAGIEAHALSWSEVVTQVAAGDDPGEVAADAAAQTALFDDSADAATQALAAAIVEQFKKALANGEIAVDSTLVSAIDTDGTTGFSDDEIEAYLQTDDAGIRVLLRNVLAQGLSEEEKAVLRAVATNTGLDAALDDADAAFSDAYKTAVKALLDRHNDGNVRVAMTGGSIVSRGDGIRAWYATPHADNGGIRVTVAEGASVTGADAGIHVANAGDGLRIQKRYAPVSIRNANQALGEADPVTVAGYLNQIVRVDGTVTGGTDAAVHLVGGGALIVGRTGRLIAGSSGRAIRVNDPGPVIIWIAGKVQGGEGAEAAVHLTGGGSLTVGLTGSVDANGADNAIQVAGGTTVTVIVPEDDVTNQAYEQRVSGRVGGDVSNGEVLVRAALADEEGTMGPVTPVPLEDGRPAPGVLADRPEGFGFDCDMASDDRCRLYEALPSVLLGMTGLPGYQERMAAARDENGAWALVEGARGKWKAESSTRDGLAYDYRRTAVRAGRDVGAGERVRVGVSVHGLVGTAEMTPGGGKAALSGVGVGVDATTTAGSVYIDAQAAVTSYDVDLTSETGTRLGNGVSGEGYALSVEVGRGMAIRERLSVTPRAGLAWSKVTLDDFTDMRDSMSRVSVEDASSLMGRAGVGLEADAGGGLRVLGSVDVMQEFSEETEAQVGGRPLKASAEKTRFRAVGGARRVWGEGRYALQGSLGYTTGGGGNREFGGGVNFTMRF